MLMEPNFRSRLPKSVQSPGGHLNQCLSPRKLFSGASPRGHASRLPTWHGCCPPLTSRLWTASCLGLCQGRWVVVMATLVITVPIIPSGCHCPERLPAPLYLRQQTQGLGKQDTLLKSLAKETGSLGAQGEGELEETYSARSQGQGEDGQDREARQHAIQFSSVAQSCPTLCDPMDCSMPGFSVHHQLPQLAQTHVHREPMNSIKRPLREESKLDA